MHFKPKNVFSRAFGTICLNMLFLFIRMRIICIVLIDSYLLVPKLRFLAIEYEFYEGKYARKCGQNDARVIYLRF